MSLWANSVTELISVLESMQKGTANLTNATEMCCHTIRSGHKILICGNGGSAADAQHFAAELMGWYENKTRQGIPAIALTTDTSCLTAIANDKGYKKVFERQVIALGQPGDILIAITTSGKSENVLLACVAALNCGMQVIALTGQELLSTHQCNIVLAVPSSHTPRIQEVHTLLLHHLAENIEASWIKND